MIRFAALLLLIVLLSAPGCSPMQPVSVTGWDPQALRPEGIIFIVPGTGGGKVSGPAIRDGLKAADCPYTIVVYTWSRGHIVEDMRDREGNLDRAHRLAGMIRTYHETHPEGVIEIVGISAGGGMIAFAIEELPDDLKIRVVLMIAPALSPGYDLTRVLRHVGQDFVNLFSSSDSLVLGFGTSVVGTMDGVKTASAGHVGFELPPKANDETRALYRKVTQICWGSEMMADGNFGNHLGWLSRGFVETHVVPLLMPEQRIRRRSTPAP